MTLKTAATAPYSISLTNLGRVSGCRTVACTIAKPEAWGALDLVGRFAAATVSMHRESAGIRSAGDEWRGRSPSWAPGESVMAR
jgi:hypothetical protein